MNKNNLQKPPQISSHKMKMWKTYTRTNTDIQKT